MSALEKSIEGAAARYARSVGVLTYKFSSPAQRGVPDRIFIGPMGTIFMEFKRPGGKPTALQQHHIDGINKVAGPFNSTTSCWVDSVEAAKVRINTIK